jgi:spermidine synthase
VLARVNAAPARCPPAIDAGHRGSYDAQHTMKRLAKANRALRLGPERAAAEALPLSALQFCFFLSGAAGLIYQLAWTKSLGLLFGYSAYATATVLAVFMGGLASGSVWLGKYGERQANPIAFYAWIEFGVAATGGASISGLALVRAIYFDAYPLLSASRISLLGLRCLGAAIVLLVPSFLMGGTLPILVRGVTRRCSELGVRISGFYAINTLGAVAGTLAAGFLLLPMLGLRRSVAIAVLLNISAAMIALRLAPRARPAAEYVQQPALKKFPAADLQTLLPSSPFLLLSFALVGGTAMAYEIAWSRLLATTVGSSTYAFTLMLATFLAGMGIGSFLFKWRIKGSRHASLQTIVSTQLATAGAALLFLLGFQYLPELIPPILRAMRGTFSGLVLAQWVTSALAMLPVAIVFGFNFPAFVVLIAGTQREGVQTSSTVGRAYAANTGGAIVAALLSGFLLLPWIGSFRVIAFAAALNLLLAVALQLCAKPRSIRTLTVSAALLSAIAFVGFSSRVYSRSFAAFGAVLYGNYHDARLTVREVADTEDVVFFEDGVNTTIAVTRSDDYVGLKTNGKVDASNLDSSTQLLLGDLGAILHPHPRRVLIIGFGGGMTASAVSRFPDVARIDCVEIEPAVFHAAPYLERLNRGVLRDPRLHLIFDDARNFLQTAREPYDLIISEPSNPWIAGVASLYTDEFYATVRKQLAPGGFFLQWVQAYSLEPSDFRMILATLTPHFPDVSVWHSAGRDFLLLARQSSEPLSFERSRALWAQPNLHDDFQTLHLAEAESWPVYFRLGDAEVRAFARGASVNSDDRTWLEYRASRSVLNEDLTAALEKEVAKFQKAPLPPELAASEVPATILAVIESALDLNSARASAVAQLLPTAPQSARAELLLGRLALQANRTADAVTHMQSARQLSNNLYSMNYWLAEAELQRGSVAIADALLAELLTHQPTNADALRARRNIARDSHTWQLAIELQLRLLELQPAAVEFCRLGDLYLRAGNLPAAESSLQDGLRRDPYSFLCRRELGELQRARGNLPDAADNLEFVIRHYPEGDPKTYVSLALVYKAQGRKKAAVEILAKGRRVFADDALLNRFKLPE